MREAGFIECHDLYKSFDGKAVLRGVNLAVERGETMAVIGGSGAGKTVLLKHMNGLIQPEAGEIFLGGEAISGKDEEDLTGIRKKIAMVFQGCALFDSLTVEDNVAYPLREHTGLSAAEIRDRVRETLGLVGLEGSDDLYPAEMSGGMKKRAALARALALRPKGLLYDEPTTGLDPIMTQRILRLIRELQEKLEVTSVMVTHDLRSAFEVADRIAFLDQGRIRFVGAKKELEASSDLALQQFLSAE